MAVTKFTLLAVMLVVLVAGTAAQYGIGIGFGGVGYPGYGGGYYQRQGYYGGYQHRGYGGGYGPGYGIGYGQGYGYLLRR